MIPFRELVDTWASLYANSAALRSGIAFAHLGALLAAGGCAIAADLWTLKAFGRGFDAVRAELHRLRGIHPLVVGSLAIVVLSGGLLTAADLDAYLASTAFWIKIALVLALVVNGAVLMPASARVEAGDAAAAGLVRRTSSASLALWFATTLMGAVLPNAL